MIFGCLLAVKDVAKARAFYEELFGLKVIADFGLNIGFDCGLNLQQSFSWLTGIPEEEIKDKENNCELYFEDGDFDGLVEKVMAREDVTLLHQVKECPWGQRVLRFYDLDNHLIEVGESMKAVVERFQSQGMTVEEICKKMDATPGDIENMLKGI